MFGYLLPDKDDLRIKEYKIYKAHYCGICNSIRKNYGRTACFLIHYDLVLLTLFASAYNFDNGKTRVRCMINPASKVDVICGRAEAYAADANLLYAYYKFVDDKRDSNSIRSNCMEYLFRRRGRRAAERLQKPAEDCALALGKLNSLEHEGCDDLDMMSALWGDAMGSVFSSIPNAGRDSVALQAVGEDLGRWLYIIDAWDDLDRDEKKGEYNVLLKRFASAEKAREERDHIAWILFALLDSAENNAQLLKENEETPVWRNILERGTRIKTQELIYGSDKGSVN